MAGPESQVGGLIAVGTGDALKCMQDLLVGACGARDGTVTCFPELSGAGVFVDGGTSKPYVNQAMITLLVDGLQAISEDEQKIAESRTAAELDAELASSKGWHFRLVWLRTFPRTIVRRTARWVGTMPSGTMSPSTAGRLSTPTISFGINVCGPGRVSREGSQ
ncbi:unnamed protein product [Pylaiella littoralis]